MFIVAPEQFGTSGLGGFCALGDGFNCEASAELIFNHAVANLTFDISGFQTGDNVLVEIFDLNNTLLSSIDVAQNLGVDFSGFSDISRILLTDSSEAAGFLYTNFSFDINSVSSPASLVLVCLGLAIMLLSRKNLSKV